MKRYLFTGGRSNDPLKGCIVATLGEDGGNFYIEVLEKREGRLEAGYKTGAILKDWLTEVPSRRFTEAVNIVDPGASNPAGVARALVEAIDECRTDGVNPKDDPACGLIVHQLYNILGGLRYDYGESGNEYGNDLKACREKMALRESLLNPVVKS